MENLSREEQLIKLGVARTNAGTAWHLVDIDVTPTGTTFSFKPN